MPAQQKIELVNVCVSGFGMIERPRIPELPPRDAATPARKAMRKVTFADGPRETAIYDRAALPAGYRLDGPAIIEEFGSTTVVFPDQVLDVDAHGILIIRPKVETEAAA